MNSAALGGKAAQLGTVAPWPFHPLAIQRGEQLLWTVVDLREGACKLAAVTPHALDACVYERAAEVVLQLCYDLHTLWDSGDYDKGYGATYITSTYADRAGVEAL